MERFVKKNHLPISPKTTFVFDELKSAIAANALQLSDAAAVTILEAGSEVFPLSISFAFPPILLLFPTV